MTEVADTTLQELEFDEILRLLAGETATPIGAARALEVTPAYETDGVDRENQLTTEMARRIERLGLLPFGDVPDASPLLARLEIEGAVLAPLEVFDLVTLMKAGRALKSALAETRAECPRLWEIGGGFPDLGNLVRFLDGKVATTGELEDQASDELHAVRLEIRRRNERLDAALAAIVGRAEVTRALQDTFISIRSDRHVIPIRSESRGAVPGIVHGVSGSGATVYVEPIETVDLNNEIVTLRDQEAAEVQRLLQEYSDLLRGRLPELRGLQAGIGRLDTLSAKARLGRRMRARPAERSEREEIRLAAARHPLVEIALGSKGLPITPLDLEVAPGTRLVAISGPNTGGKTVALKTAGLMALMFQSGIPVPADRALLPVFRGVFIDIGDRQSITDRLSTFSARMTNIAGITRRLRAPALVLLDEVGTGTDPEDGVALATAIIDDLRTRGALVIATTHLEALKAYAATTAGCANAAMQFDEATSTPTYRLLPGIPGRSGGLEIAERLGLPPEILQAARARRGRSGDQIAAYLARLQAMSTEAEERLREARREQERLATERSALVAEFREREERRRLALQTEIETALRSMREEGERYLAAIKDRSLALALQRQEMKAAAALRQQARALIRRAAGDGPDVAPRREVAPGSAVWIQGLGVRGTVEAVRGERVVVVVRGKRMTVSIADCRTEAPEMSSAGPRLPPGVSLQRASVEASPSEIRLLGRTVEEALALVDKYLDDVYLEGLSPVRVVHGTGSGRLKRAIAELLGRHPHVETFAAAPADQGGAGVTIVRLRL